MATPNLNEPHATAAPAVGTRLSVRVDEGMSDDLAVIMRTGCNASDAVRRALILLSNICHETWSRGHYPDGVMPHYTSAIVEPYDPDRTPEQGV
ncbi:hypothetical protein [Streptomyces sp. NBC_00519]|uniref:hypothetical protein n=1 Tax=Streptomyces sp. NBC_00519 TaxID=2975764 RepID=UPI0030DEC83F